MALETRIPIYIAAYDIKIGMVLIVDHKYRASYEVIEVEHDRNAVIIRCDIVGEYTDRVNHASWEYTEVLDPHEQVQMDLRATAKNFAVNTCPKCSNGVEGKDALCDSCYSEYLGTHLGARNE